MPHVAAHALLFRTPTAFMVLALTSCGILRPQDPPLSNKEPLDVTITSPTNGDTITGLDTIEFIVEQQIDIRSAALTVNGSSAKDRWMFPSLDSNDAVLTFDPFRFDEGLVCTLIVSVLGTDERVGHSPPVYVVRGRKAGSFSASFGGSGSQYGRDIAVVHDSGLIAAGMSRPPLEKQSDVYLVRLTNDGDIVWTNTFDGGGDDVVVAVHPASDGGFLVCGSCSGAGMIHKTNARGALQWQARLDTLGLGSVAAVVETREQTYWITGPADTVGGPLVLANVDRSGNVIRSKQYFEEQGGAFGSVLLRSVDDTGYVAAGGFGDGAGGMAFVLRFDESGDSVWCGRYGLAGGSAYSIGCVDNGNEGYVVAAGTFVKTWFYTIDARGNEISRGSARLGSLTETAIPNALCRHVHGTILYVGNPKAEPSGLYILVCVEPGSVVKRGGPFAEMLDSFFSQACTPDGGIAVIGDVLKVKDSLPDMGVVKINRSEYEVLRPKR